MDNARCLLNPFHRVVLVVLMLVLDFLFLRRAVIPNNSRTRDENEDDKKS
jgi:hypothetical protein